MSGTLASENTDARRTNSEYATVGTVALRTCTISFTGPSGVRHSVDVTAESVYEAAALGVSALKKDTWVDVVAPGSDIEVRVSEPAVCAEADPSLVRRCRCQPGRDAQKTAPQAAAGLTM